MTDSSIFSYIKYLQVTIQDNLPCQGKLSDVKALKVLKEEQNIKRSIIVSLDDKPKKLGDNIESLPWQDFLDLLWAGNIC